ncbi:hypothetical protein OQJ18_04420 [Fluoribacter dumoffii]|uniref:Uncharacterized protein n=1 Tax=Fluoribacter dumoffii TaxID=463 RepID=A0A377G9L2_9GAMM|nr:hypothetical protein [Fluoribacter dumoffii]KTC90323.1 hypothetical protein Ldum_1391 [Fluoribacter dumoffii NY 23]MCW8385640.1 hypothetical protein [Fluoribacter dumoffii]MCW8418669.1 hypothetical protein [Fluoribacter dumoffii]MCW8453487.1 hypothetical protein [Fluoribacter dumoffii]MCW8459293.1 hypothetical protein [Fluoribacter dumoffii]
MNKIFLFLLITVTLSSSYALGRINTVIPTPGSSEASSGGTEEPNTGAGENSETNTGTDTNSSTNPNSGSEKNRDTHSGTNNTSTTY